VLRYLKITNKAASYPQNIVIYHKPIKLFNHTCFTYLTQCFQIVCRQPMNDTKTNNTNALVFLDLRFRVRVWRVRNSTKCRYFGSQFTLYALHSTLPITNTRGGCL